MNFVWNYQKQKAPCQKRDILLTTILLSCFKYYSLIFPFLTYGVHVWDLTFPSFLTQLFIIYLFMGHAFWRESIEDIIGIKRFKLLSKDNNGWFA